MPAALVIAAGVGRRFGSDKRLHVLPDGQALLIASLAPYVQAGCAPRFVAIRCSDPAVLPLLQAQASDWRILRSANAASGMGHTIADATSQLRDVHKGALLVGLGDMPYLQATTVDALAAALAVAPHDSRVLVQPRYRGRPGNPVGFPAARVAELCTLQGDRGARDIVRAASASAEVMYLDVDDVGVTHDVDNPDHAVNPD